MGGRCANLDRSCLVRPAMTCRCFAAADAGGRGDIGAVADRLAGLVARPRSPQVRQHRWDETVLALTRYLCVRRAVPKAPRQRSWALASTHAAGSADLNVQAPELVLPTGLVVADVGGRQAAVREHDRRAVAVRVSTTSTVEPPGRQRVAAGGAPAEHDAVRRVDGDVGTAGEDLAPVEREHAAELRSSSAQSPIHLTMSAGSVKYGNTTAGGALMCSVAAMTSSRISAVTASLRQRQRLRLPRARLPQQRNRQPPPSDPPVQPKAPQSAGRALAIGQARRTSTTLRRPRGRRGDRR
jgi:hypothetical protein